MAADTEIYPLYRSQAATSGYVGTENRYIVIGSVTGQLTPVRDQTTLAQYGNKVDQMYELICSKPSDIRKNDKIEVHGDYFKVVAVKPFRGHYDAVVERTGVL